MKRINQVGLGALVMLLFAAGASPAAAGDFVAGMNMGTEAGFGVHLHGTFRDFTRDVPLSLRLAVGYHVANAGDPYLARRVFINDNTNGTPEDSAKYLQFRCDLLFPLLKAGRQQIHLFGGVRHARYKAEFIYVGGNEDFEIRTNPWGLGLGVESYFPLSDSAEFMLQLGVDHFLDAEIYGHDTTYTPDGDHINPRDGYGYDDADDAIDQPRTEILAMVGIQFRL